MANVQDELAIKRAQAQLEALGWELVGLDKRGGVIQITFEKAKEPAKTVEGGT